MHFNYLINLQMKKLFIISITGLALCAGCGNNKQEATTVATDTTTQFFGAQITTDGAIAVEQLVAQMQGKDSLKVKITGKIEAVCQKKGCWMNINIGNNQSMKVSFKDYAFFVPKDASGKTVFAEGVAYNDTTSVDDLKHYAQDAGKTKEEIENITQPEINIGFEANGVIIKI